MSPRNLQARELLLRLDRNRPGSISRQLEEQVRNAIQSGTIASGENLPSSRVLAEDLGISRGAVVRAYAQLATEGYISMRQGAAPAVRATVRFDATSAPPPNGRFRVVYNLEPDLPEVATFPRQAWLRAVRVVVGIIMFATLAVITFNFLVDVLYAWLDPRIRLA